MKLYYTPKTRSSRPRWILEEMGVEYQIIPINLQQGEHKTPDFLKINPMGQVPALQDGSVTLFESAAIVAYLADKYADKKMAPPLNSPERGAYYQWMFFSMTSLDAHVGGYFYHTQLYPEPKRIAAYANLCVGNFQQAAKVLDAHLKDRQFMVGNTFSAADVMIAGNLGFAKSMKLLEDFPTLLDYLKRQTSRPAFLKSIS